MATKATTEQINAVQIGAEYTYTNKFGIEFKLKVTRVTESSVFAYQWLKANDGSSNAGWSTIEARNGWKEFSKYSLK